MMQLTNDLYELLHKVEGFEKYKVERMINRAQRLEEMEEASLRENGVIQVSSREYKSWQQMIEERSNRLPVTAELYEKYRSENRELRRIVIEFENLFNCEIKKIAENEYRVHYK